MRVQSSYWSLAVPLDWSVTQTEECVTLESKHVAGTLQVSAAMKTEGGDVTNDDLQDFASDDQGTGSLRKVRAGQFEGYSLSCSTSDIGMRKWWLRSGRVMVFCTYITDAVEPSKDDEEIVDSILASLRREAD